MTAIARFEPQIMKKKYAAWGRLRDAVSGRKRFKHVGVTVLNTASRLAVFLSPQPAPRNTPRTPSTLNQSHEAKTYPGTDSDKNRPGTILNGLQQNRHPSVFDRLVLAP